MGPYKNENAMWGGLRRAVNARTRVVMWKTTPTGAHNRGWPDIDYCVDGAQGKLELKYDRTWPKRESTPVRPGLTPNQRVRLREWAEAGGRAYVLWGIHAEWYLLPFDCDEEYAQDELRHRCVTFGKNWDELIDFLRGDY